ncbi:MAG: hypothetical protein J5666_03510, partial [Bacilli bacterium]|nr:hypothetical protein [Bacilli bacterium]
MVLDRKQKRIVLLGLIVYFLVIVWVIMFKMGLVPLEEISARGPYFIPFQFVYNIYLENNLHLLPRQIIVMIVNF